MFQSISHIATEIRWHRRHLRLLENVGENGSVTCENVRRRLADAEYRLVGRCERNVLEDGGYDLYFETMLDRVCSK